MTLEVHPLTKDRWRDLVELFGRPGGAMVPQCWCMYYRRSGGGRAVHLGDSPTANRVALKSLVDRGTVPGLIGYRKRATGGLDLIGTTRGVRQTVALPGDGAGR
jgi:hypothetical protein